MKTYHVIPYSRDKDQFASSDFAEAFYSSKLLYSLRHLTLTGSNSEESIMDALQRSLQVCYLAGVNSTYHFKKIYVFDENIKTLCIDWLMSKNGFNLMIMQIPSLNEKKARWLWELAER